MPLELLDISIGKPKLKAKAAEVFHPRKFEDGSIEIRLSNGVRRRVAPEKCLNCGSVRADSPFRTEEIRASLAKLCVPCFQMELVAREQALEFERAERRKIGETPAQRRYVALVLATPLWRDRAKIKEIYDEAKRLSDETGIPHEVDHIYPIQSQFACGLHVHNNLQILEKTRNRSKSNDFPFGDSPALWE